ncbi:MAG: UTP--glucose-1-phosphate uridylyltransferase [Lentisphaeria bacterium]|nr:UTP--glucose-1-phosphate uridylyltransferase [Lentisphaeria bacterium]
MNRFPVVRKAVIPAAGFGTRFLPFSRAVPKEMLPLVDKPVIQYVVEEAAASGIEEILIIVSDGKEAIRNHFSPAVELEKRLAGKKRTAELAELDRIDRLAKLHYVRQEDLNGLGGAMQLAREFAGNDPVAVLLGDTVVTGHGKPVTAQLCDAWRQTGASVFAVEEVPPDKVSRYGIIRPAATPDGPLYRVADLVEKPAAADAPSRLAIASRYLFTPGIFAALAETLPGQNGEIQLSDAMRRLIATEPLYALRFAGRRHDIGNKLDFMKSTVEFGLRRPEFRDALVEFICNQARELEKNV